MKSKARLLPLIVALSPAILANPPGPRPGSREEPARILHEQVLPVQKLNMGSVDVWIGQTRFSYLTRPVEKMCGCAVRVQVRNVTGPASGSFRVATETEGPGAAVPISGPLTLEPLPVLLLGGEARSCPEPSGGAIQWELRVPAGSVKAPPELELSIVCR